MAVQTQWLTRKQVADLTGFAVQTLKNWAVQGRGPRYVVVPGTRRVRYPETGVAEWQQEPSVAA